MKRRLLSNLLILGLSSLTLLGTGFSIFYFTSTTATDSYSLEVNLARTEVHSLSVRESSDSVLHIDSTVSSQVSGYNSPIYWMNRNTDSEYEYSEGFSLNLYTEDTVSYNFTFTISLDLTIPSELANYITWDNNVSDGWTITGSNTTYTISSNLSNISITPDADYVLIIPFNFVYVSGMEPDTYDEKTALDNLSGLDITVDVSLEE